MKYVEIILKVLFVVGVVIFFTARSTFFEYINSFVLTCLFLGIILIFNQKHQSYGYRLSKREIVIRIIEGVLLVSFALALGYFKYAVSSTYAFS